MGLMFISLKANKQSCGPPLASKTRCVLSNPLGFSPYLTAHKKGAFIGAFNDCRWNRVVGIDGY